MIRWLALSALLAGCSGSQLVYVDERFTAEEQAQIQAAADVWPVQIDLLFGQHVTAYDTGRRTVVKTDMHVIRHVLDEHDLPNKGAVTIASERILIAMEVTGTAHMTHVMAHEFGHMLGAHHVEDPSAVMFQSTSLQTPLCISKADAAGYLRDVGQTIPITCASVSNP